MHILPVLLILWCVLTVALIAVLIYRATLTQHETDQLFLTDAETTSASHEEHDRICAKVERLKPVCRSLWGATIVATIAIAGLWISQNLPQF